ncbi:MAG: hypothetical protein OSB69_05540 [Alphaproteobacteria bacterium]|nr:hypothetical protein [Alphaproteobacteria bacterium]
MAMMDAARAMIGDGVPAFEVALATAVAALLAGHYQGLRVLLQIHFL